jgi:hypothetical protein
MLRGTAWEEKGNQKKGIKGKRRKGGGDYDQNT